jgi:hypothetical protein
MKFLLSCLVSVTILSVALLAADKKSANKKLSKGDKVEVEFLGKTIVAEFEDYANNAGWINAKFKFNGQTMTRMFPAGQYTVVSKKDKGGSGAKLRTWTDSTGKYKVKARFIQLDDDELTLETEEGKTVTMSLKKLSKADQKAAQDAAKEAEENPFKEKDDEGNPFEEGAKGADSGDGDDAPEANWSSVSTVAVSDPGKWALKPDAAPATEKPVNKPIILASTVKSKGKGELPFFEHVDNLLFDRGRGRALVVIRDGSPGKELDVKLQRVDLLQGKAGEPFNYPSKMKPVDLDPAGEQLLSRDDFMFSPRHKVSGVGIWKLEEKGLKKVKTFSAHEPGEFHKGAPEWAQFVDADHIITVSFPNKLAMFQVSKARAVYKMDLAHGSGIPALSANRKYLAVSVNDGVYILDALTGDSLAKMPGDPGSVSALSFRPDGTQLAGFSAQRLSVWNLEKGDLYRDIYFSQALHATKIDWLDRGYLLVGGQNLIDLDRRIVLWRYQFEGMNAGSPAFGESGGAFWYALTSQDRKERGLFRARLPHEEALKTAASLRADDLLAVKPGAQVSLSVNVQGDPNEQQKALNALTAQLRQLGMSVVNGGSLVLQASTETGKTSTIEYHAFGRLGGSEKATVTEQISRLKFVENGKVIWEAVSVSGAPHILHMKQGETAQQALAPYQRPNVQFFVNVKVPQYVARPSEAGAYGASQFTPQGIQDIPLKAQQPGVAGR